MKLSTWFRASIRSHIKFFIHMSILTISSLAAVRCGTTSPGENTSDVKAGPESEPPTAGGGGGDGGVGGEGGTGHGIVVKCVFMVKRLQARLNPDGTTGAIRLTFFPYAPDLSTGEQMTGVINVTAADLAALPPDNVATSCETLPPSLQMANPLYGVKTPMTCPQGTTAPETQCTPAGPTVQLPPPSESMR